MPLDPAPDLTELQAMARAWTTLVRQRDTVVTKPMPQDEFARLCDATSEAAAPLFKALHALSDANDAEPDADHSPSLADIRALARPWTKLVRLRKAGAAQALSPAGAARLHDDTMRAGDRLFTAVHALADAPDVVPASAPGMR